MHILFIYLIGCLIGLGIGGTVLNSKDYQSSVDAIPKTFLFYCIFFSWITVLFLIFGVIRGLLGEEDDS